MILLIAMLIHSLVWFLIDLVSAWGPDIITEKHKKWLQGNCIESGPRLMRRQASDFQTLFIATHIIIGVCQPLWSISALDEKYLSVLISNFPILLICDLWCGVTFPACLQTSSLVITEWYEDQWQWSLITCNYWPQTWQTGHPVLTRDPISHPELGSQPRPRSRLRIIKISIKWSKSFSLSRLRLSQMPSVLASTIWCLVSGLSARLKLKVTFLTIVNENWN